MTIEISPLTIHTGAEISGVDITQPLSQGDAGEIWDAFLKWKVVVFRNQKMDHAQQVAFARTFGDLTIGHAVFGHVDGYPEVYSVAKNRWDNRLAEKYSSLDGLPRRHYRRAQSAVRLHPAWRHHSALWRRHILGESCRSV